MKKLKGLKHAPMKRVNLLVKKDLDKIEEKMFTLSELQRLQEENIKNRCFIWKLKEIAIVALRKRKYKQALEHIAGAKLYQLHERPEFY